MRKVYRASALIFASMMLVACQPSKDGDKENAILRPVKTLTVEPAHDTPYKDFAAVVDASQKVNLAFKVGGRISQMPVKLGEPVAKGDLIARLDDTDIKLDLEQAQSNFDKAKSDYDRGKELIKAFTISQADFDTLKSQFNSAKVQLESAQNRLEYTHLYATFSGVIAQKQVENFQEVQVGQAIVTLHDINQINLKVDVPESVIIGVKPGAPVPQVKASFTAIPDTSFDLSFKEISTQADEITKTYQVVFTMPNSTTHTILPGMSATVRVSTPDAQTSLANFYLPAHSVLQDEGGNYVYVVQDNQDGTGTISRKNVTIGDITVYGIEIFSGIVVGDKVLNAGMSKVSEGMLVKYKA